MISVKYTCEKEALTNLLRAKPAHTQSPHRWSQSEVTTLPCGKPSVHAPMRHNQGASKQQNLKMQSLHVHTGTKPQISNEKYNQGLRLSGV